MNSKLILSVATAALLFSSCRKNEDSTPDTRAILSYQLKAADPSVGTSAKVAANGNFQWTGGYAYPREMRFGVKADGSIYSNDHVTDYRSMDTARVDLFVPTSRTFGHIALAQGTYNEVEMRVKISPRAIAPAMRLRGTYTSSATGVQLPVMLEVFDACELKTEVKTVNIEKKTNFQAVTSLDLSTLGNGITEAMISNAELKEGTLVISNYTNKDLYNLVIGNLKNNRHAVQVSQR